VSMSPKERDRARLGRVSKEDRFVVKRMLVSRIFTSWNRLTTWLRQVERLRLAA
jgi:ribosome biogenesis protein Tsr3